MEERGNQLKVAFLVSIIVLSVFSTFLSAEATNNSVLLTDVLDTTSITITHIPVTNATAGQAITIYANVTSDSAFIEVTLHFIEAGGCWCEEQNVTMTKSHEGTNTYNATISAHFVTRKGIQYYIKATDGIDSVTAPPRDPSGQSLASYKIVVPPTAVTLQNPTSVTENSMQLTWAKNNDADFAKYEIYQSTSPGTLGTLIHTIEDRSITSYTVTDLEANTTYYFTVRVKDTDGSFTDSNQVSEKTALSATTLPWIWLVALAAVIAIGVAVLVIIKILERKRRGGEEPSIGVNNV